MCDSISQMELQKFNNSVLKFIDNYTEYSDRNVKSLGENTDDSVKQQLNNQFGYCENTNYMVFEMFTEIPSSILMDIYDILQSFVQICETHDLNKAFTTDDKEFVSGAKCIDNIIKHKKKDFSVTDFITPNIVLENKSGTHFIDVGNGNIGIPMDDLVIRLGAVWVPLKQEIKDGMNNKSHFPFYAKWFEGKDIIFTVHKVYEIIQEYII